MQQLFEFFFGLNYNGFIIGTGTLISIWLTRWACIRGEYHFTKKFWIVFFIVGIASLAIGFLLIDHVAFSAVVCIFGFSNLWAIGEVIEQEKRVDKGWFPKKNRAKFRDLNS